MLTALALKLGAPKWAIIAGLVTLLILAAGLGKCAYDRSVIRAHEAEREAEQAKREEKADANLYRQKELDDAAARQRQKEIDDATRNIPDQSLSARQLARACLELRRQAPTTHHPACEPARAP